MHTDSKLSEDFLSSVLVAIEEFKESKVSEVDYLIKRINAIHSSDTCTESA